MSEEGSLPSWMLHPVEETNELVVWSLRQLAIRILRTSDPYLKCERTLQVCSAWNQGLVPLVFCPIKERPTIISPPSDPSDPFSFPIRGPLPLDETTEEEEETTLTTTENDEDIDEITSPSSLNKIMILPDIPSRPTKNFQKKALESLSEESRRRYNKVMKKNQIEYTIHGVANAESYAIDLFWDLIARFYYDTVSNEVLCDRNIHVKGDGNDGGCLTREFFDSMVYIAEQEAQHFTAWNQRLQSLGFTYGCFPLPSGLWQSAGDTKCDILARLSVINLTHEAKGLDTVGRFREKLQSLKDDVSLAILEKNFSEEIGHVRFGALWFRRVAYARGFGGLTKYVAPHLEGDEQDDDESRVINLFHDLSRRFFYGKLREPFNHEARAIAGLTEDWYLPIAGEAL